MTKSWKWSGRGTQREREGRLASEKRERETKRGDEFAA